MQAAARGLAGLTIAIVGMVGGACAAIAQDSTGPAQSGYLPHAADAMFGGGSPAWLSRVYGSFEWRDGDDPLGVVETVQPLYQSFDRTRTLFFQGRIAVGDDDGTLNLGGGYRFVLPEHEDWLFGVNAFYDRNFDVEHERWGIGAEAIGRFTTLRANYYDPLSDWITVQQSPFAIVQERALEGFDAEIETPLPFAPWASLAGGYYYWDVTAPGGDDINGFRGTLRMDLTQSVRLEAGIEADNDETAALIELRIAFGPSEHVEYTAWDDVHGVPYDYLGRDIMKHTLVRVERNNEIVTEQRVVSLATGATSGGVIIGRGR